MLNSSEVGSLKNLIRDSFRVRENQDPVYVDIGGNLARFESAQHQILFGRRGSGKSCLLVHVLRNIEEKDGTKVIYVGVDEIKKLGFPDILVRILLSIFENLPGARKRFWHFRESRLQLVIKELRALLDTPERSDTETKLSREESERLAITGAGSVPINLGLSRGSTRETSQKFVSLKLDQLERHLQDYKSVLRTAARRTKKYFVLIDDFYLVSKDLQPNVVDYVHRLLRGTSFYLKLATIRHRTLLRKHESQTIGVEIFQDVEEISLDKTFETFEATNDYLHAMLQSMAGRVSKDFQVAEMFNPDAPRALTIASGGVPRDFLNIFVDAIDASLQAGKSERLTPTFVYKASAALSYKNKLTNIKEEAGYDSAALEKLFIDLLIFCLKEKKKTAFLISREDAQKFPVENELLQQLMDFKLIHLIESNTSAASGRAGRFAAYTLDFSLFMDPRKRGIEIVEFWKTDDQRRPIGVRESPDYPLGRLKAVLESAGQADAEDVLGSVENEVS